MKNLIKEIVPEIKDIKLPCARVVKHRYLQKWQEYYGFTLKEFLTNKKYVVVSDTDYHDVEGLIDLGLFNWSDIERSSYEDEDDLNYWSD